MVPASQRTVAMEVNPFAGAGTQELGCLNAIMFQCIGKIPDISGEAEKQAEDAPPHLARAPGSPHA